MILKKALDLAILGISGKMGRCLAHLAKEDPEINLIGGATSGKKSSSLPPFPIEKKERLFQTAEVLIDFSTPEALPEHLSFGIAHQKPLLIGTTGLKESHWESLQKAAKSIPILYSANFSQGIAWLEMLLEKMIPLLDSHWSIDLIETHHREKKDSPSGTALSLAKACPRPLKAPIQSIRLDYVPGIHTLVLQTQGEKIEITHSALGKEAFALGALKAAKELKNFSPGFYTLRKTS
jgi:4-hydroxy-tetrahydrodipicolinate reductase